MTVAALAAVRINAVQVPTAAPTAEPETPAMPADAGTRRRDRDGLVRAHRASQYALSRAAEAARARRLGLEAHLVLSAAVGMLGLYSRTADNVSRQQLADATGLDPSNVGRALRALDALGIVTWRPSKGRPPGKAGSRCRARSWLRLPDAPEGWAYGRKAPKLEHDTGPTAAEMATLPDDTPEQTAAEKTSHSPDPISGEKTSHSYDPHPRDETTQGGSPPTQPARPSRPATTEPAITAAKLEQLTDLQLVRMACPDRPNLSTDAAARHDTERNSLAGRLPALSPYYRRHLTELVNEGTKHAWARNLEAALTDRLATATADAWQTRAHRRTCSSCQGAAMVLEGNTAKPCPSCRPPTEPAWQQPEQPWTGHATPTTPSRQLAGCRT